MSAFLPRSPGSPGQRVAAERGSAARPRGRSPGFSLVEMLLSSVIIAVGLLGMLGVFSVSSFDLTKSGGALRAAGLAQQRIEELRNLSTADLVALPADATATATIDGRTYTVRTQLTVTNVQTSPTLLRRIDVTVIVTGTAWPEARGHRLDTIIGERF